VPLGCRRPTRRRTRDWEWASSDRGEEPDVVLACAGDIPTLESVAAASILRQRLPDLPVRVVNVVDLMRLQPASEHPHRLSDSEFDALFHHLVFPDSVSGLLRCDRRMVDVRLHQRAHTREFGEDSPEVRDWTWSSAADPA
jgi:phosphoketolase